MNKYDKKHLNNLNTYQQRIADIFASAARDAANLSALIGNLGDKPLSWSDYPLAEAQVNKIIERLNSDLHVAIVNGVRSEWTLSNNKNNELCQQVFGSLSHSLPEQIARRYYSTNGDALDAFIQRKNSVTGLSLSDNVWNYTNQFKNEIEMALDLGIRSGRSADEMSRDVRDFLKHPDKLFRRVRDEHGMLHLSKRASLFHPGQGVYRSSYLNARRLTATETNIAYRTADHLRWQQLDFVVGIRIVLSNNHTCLGRDGKPHPFEDICDQLSAPYGSTYTSGQGCYPKDFKFVGWHPHCRCHAESILKTDEEIAEDNRRILDGEDVSERSVNEVTTPPEGFTKWLDENGTRIDEARKHGTLPYFIRDNERKDWFNASMSSRYDEQYLQAMSERGIKFGSGLADKMANSPYNRLDVVRLNDNIQDIFAKQGITDLSCTMRTSPDGGVHLSWRGNGVELKRAFRIDDNGAKYVDHELFQLDRQLQGKGVSRQVFKALYEQYRVAGVERIELYANIDVGGYAWARYGFCVRDRNEAISAIHFSALTAKQEKRIMGLIDGHFNASSDPFPMNKIARLPYGKKALLGSDWEGVLDLTDTQQRRVFERYLRR